MIIFIFCPKPFLSEAKFDIIQKNSILSALNLNIDKKIIVVGDDFGVDTFCKKYGFINENIVEKGVQGTPLVRSIFAQGIKHATNDTDILCYVNSDIIFYSGFEETINSLSFFIKNNEKYLFIGQRLDWNKPIDINFDDTNWKNIINVDDLTLQPPDGIDYFIFNKNTFSISDLPPFAIGKWHYDRWLVNNAFQNNIPIIDITKTNKMIHQNSLHYCNGKTYDKLPITLPEAKINISFKGAKNINESQYYLDINFKIYDRKTRHLIN